MKKWLALVVLVVMGVGVVVMRPRPETIAQEEVTRITSTPIPILTERPTQVVAPWTPNPSRAFDPLPTATPPPPLRGLEVCVPEIPGQLTQLSEDAPFRLHLQEPSEIILVSQVELPATHILSDFDAVMIRAVPDINHRLAELLAGLCDLVYDLPMTALPFLGEAQSDGLLAYGIAPIRGSNAVHLDFNIARQSDDRIIWFADPAMRQAVAQCIDKVAFLGNPEPAYAGADSGLQGVFPWPYDVDAANSRLDTLTTLGNESFRRHLTSQEPFRVSLIYDYDASTRLQWAELIDSQLAECHIDVVPRAMDTEAYEEAYRAGEFDLALAESRITSEQSCIDYMPIDEANGYGSRNVMGWVNGDFDTACLAGNNAEPNSLAYVTNHHMALDIFMQEVPSLMLISEFKIGPIVAVNVEGTFRPLTTFSLYAFWELIGLSLAE